MFRYSMMTSSAHIVWEPEKPRRKSTPEMSLILVTVAVIATFVAFMSVIGLVALAVTSHLSKRRPAPMAPAGPAHRDRTIRPTRSDHASSVA